MCGVFYNASAFNEFNDDVSKWDTSAVTTMKNSTVSSACSPFSSLDVEPLSSFLG
jgi:surface protein